VIDGRRGFTSICKDSSNVRILGAYIAEGNWEIDTSTNKSWVEIQIDNEERICEIMVESRIKRASSSGLCMILQLDVYGDDCGCRERRVESSLS
jgi:hypothetical protein